MNINFKMSEVSKPNAAAVSSAAYSMCVCGRAVMLAGHELGASFIQVAPPHVSGEPAISSDLP
jgi:hypothetical protein